MSHTGEEENLEETEEKSAEESQEGGSPAEPVEDGGGEAAEETEKAPQREVEKWKDIAARAQADLDNFRKRMAREKADAILYANQSLLEQLFPIIDNLDMGLKAARDTEGDSSIIFQGMNMVYKQLQDFLADHGVEVVEADGKPFDPNLHEAIKQEPHDTVPEGNVIHTLRRGYRLRDRLLRAANVVVSSGPEQNG
ncbi:MAG: nucleotide exchange factor GrpE [Verrucomicrobiales bacterium]